jgi:conjugal transfer ATP-binding protein TraC
MFKFEKLFTVQSYAEAYGVFLTADEATKEQHLACVWTTQPLTGLDDSGLSAIISALSLSVNPGAIIQFGLLSTPEIDDYLNSYMSPKYQSKGIIRELSDRTKEFMESGTNEPLLPSSGVKLHRKQLVITFKEPVKSFDEMYLKEFAEKATRFSSSLNAAKIRLERLDESGYLKLARKINHIYEKYDDRYDESISISEQQFYAGDNVSIFRDKIAFNTGSSPDNNYFGKVLSIKYFPQTTSLALMNYLIGSPNGINNQVKNPFYYVASFVFPTQHVKAEHVNTKSSWINNQAFGPMGRIPKVRYRKEGIDTLVNEMAAGNAVLVDFNLSLWFFAKTEKELDETINSCRTYFDSIGLIAKEDNYILDALWAFTSPINSSVGAFANTRRYFSMSTRQAAQFLPIFGEPTGPAHPVTSLVTRRGEVGGFDLFASNGNYNAVIVASSGSGKSVLTQRLICDYLAEGAKVWVVDAGHSYKKLAKSMGDRGTYLEFDPQAPMIMNPFSQFLPDRGGADKDIHTEKAGLINIIERMASSRDILSDIEISVISEAIESVFGQRFGRTTIRDVVDFLNSQHQNETAQRIGRALYEFSTGSYSQWFNGESEVKLDNDFVVLELDNLKDDNRLMTSVITVLMNEISHEIYRGKNNKQKKILIIDEAWRLIQDPLVVKAIEENFRTFRKYDSSMIVVTQDIDDLYNSDHSRAMVNNASWLLVLQQKESAVQSAINSGKLNIDEYGQYLMKSLLTSAGEYSDLMVINNGDYGLYRLILDKFTQVMFSTKGGERNDILAAIERGEDAIDAINEYMMGNESYSIIQQIKQLASNAVSSGKSLAEVKRYLQEIF